MMRLYIYLFCLFRRRGIMIRIPKADKKYVLHVFRLCDDEYIIYDDEEDEHVYNPCADHLSEEYITKYIKDNLIGLYEWSLADGMTPLTNERDANEAMLMAEDIIVCVTGPKKILRVEIPYTALTRYSKFLDYDYTHLGHIKYICIKEYSLFVPYHWMIAEVDLLHDCIVSCNDQHFGAFEIRIFKSSDTPSYFDMWFYDSTRPLTGTSEVYEMIRDQVSPRRPDIATMIMCAGRQKRPHAFSDVQILTTVSEDYN